MLQIHIYLYLFIIIILYNRYIMSMLCPMYWNVKVFSLVRSILITFLYYPAIILPRYLCFLIQPVTYKTVLCPTCLQFTSSWRKQKTYLKLVKNNERIFIGFLVSFDLSTKPVMEQAGQVWPLYNRKQAVICSWLYQTRKILNLLLAVNRPLQT